MNLLFERSFATFLFWQINNAIWNWENKYIKMIQIVIANSKVVITWPRFDRIKFQPAKLGQISPNNYEGKSRFVPARWTVFHLIFV